MSTVRGWNVRSRRAAWVLAAAGVAACMPLAGCDNQSAISARIEDAARRLDASSPGASQTPSVAFRDGVLSSIVTELNGVIGQGSAAENAAASLLVSRAQMGLAEAPASTAADAAATALNRARVLRAALDQWTHHQAQAASLDKLSPESELAQLEDAQKRVEETLAQRQEGEQRARDRVSSMLNSAKVQLDLARQMRQGEAELRQRALAVSQTEALELIKQANTQKRAAEGVEKLGAQLQAEAAQIEPLVPEFQQAVASAQRQRDMMIKEREAVRARAAMHAEQAKDHRDRAAKAGADVERLAGELIAFQNGEVAQATESAARAFQQAAASAKKAVSESRSGGNLAAGRAQQALGDVLWSRAQGLEAHALLMEAIAAASPAVPGGAKYAQEATAAREARKTALEQATEAYQAAKSAFESAGGGEEVKSRLDRVNRRLTDALFVTSGGAIDQRAELAAQQEAEAPAAEEPATEAPAADASGVPAELTAMIDQWLSLSREGRHAETASLFLTTSPQQSAMLTNLLAVSGKMLELDKAVNDRFGQTLTQALSGMNGGANMGGLNMERLMSLQSSDMAITVNGDEATGAVEGMPTPFTFKKVNGNWLIDLSRMPGMDASTMQMMAPMLGGMSKTIDELTAEVVAGRYASVQAVVMAFGMKMQQSMMGGGGGGG